MEIEIALQQTPSDRAPGPDGINGGCLKYLWPNIKDKIFETFVKFMKDGFLPPGFNSSFVALISKSSSPKEPKDFRPISLMNSIAKLLTKVLANRVNTVINKLVDEVQSAFISGRQIAESIFQVSEVCHSLKSKGCKGLVLKIDFEKAFDSINWDFLLEVLQVMGFGERFINWIRVLLNSMRISILVNGSPTKEFTPNRGLRQGDPLSPLLFILVGEVLNKLIAQARKINFLKGISFPGSHQEISLLQFVDDTILFIEDNMNSIRAVKKILQIFQMLSGLKINLDKSNLYAMKDNGTSLSESARVLGCLEGHWPLTYLGATIGISPKRKLFWDPLAKKFQDKLVAWKCESLNLAGRVILVSDILNSLPIYWFSVFKMPVSVSEKLDKIRRSFLWGECSDKESKRKIHMLSWNKVVKKKSSGGLGLSSIQYRNASMLGK